MIDKYPSEGLRTDIEEMLPELLETIYEQCGSAEEKNPISEGESFKSYSRDVLEVALMAIGVELLERRVVESENRKLKLTRRLN